MRLTYFFGDKLLLVYEMRGGFARVSAVVKLDFINEQDLKNE
jgi:hypothetical protein